MEMPPGLSEQQRKAVSDGWSQYQKTLPQAAQMAAYKPSSPASNTKFTSGWNEAMKAYDGTPGMKVTPAYTFGGQGIGNLAYASQRPEAFSSQMSGFGGQPVQPSQYMAQRDAFIQRLNEERGRQAAQSGVYYPNEIPKFYQPSRDFDALWKQAGDMVQDGWTNPLAGLFS